MHIQSLENRTLYSVTFDSATGILRWSGTGSDDQFELNRSGNIFLAIDNGTTTEFTNVTYLLANGRSGNDRIMVSQRVVIPTRLSGQDGNDTLLGGGGNDFLVGGLGDDSLDGGQRGDRVDYSTSSSGVTFNLIASKGLMKGTVEFGGEFDTLANIDLIIGSNFNDTYQLNGVGPSPSGYVIGDLVGPGQDDAVAELGSNESLPAVHAGDGDDLFRMSGVVAARLFGDAGADRFNCTIDPTSKRPYGWVDYIDGGADRDTQSISGQFGPMPGYTINNPGSIFNRLYPNIETARLTDADFGTDFYGNDLDNAIISTSSPVAIHGQGGNDLIHFAGTQTEQIIASGGLGNDIIEASEATGAADVLSAIIHGDAGNDRIWGTNGPDSLYGDEGSDQTGGFAGDDYIYDVLGGGGQLYGDDGDDTLIGYDSGIQGGNGNDTIRSTGGRDRVVHRIYGDAGDDLIKVHNHAYERVYGGLGNDRASYDRNFDRLDSIEVLI